MSFNLLGNEGYFTFSHSALPLSEKKSWLKWRMDCDGVVYLINKDKTEKKIEYDYSHNPDNKKVIIVGNSGSSLDAENGKKIDEFDITIRTNCFEISGYEKWVGSKVHTIFFGGHSPAWKLVLERYGRWKRNPYKIKEIYFKGPKTQDEIHKVQTNAPKGAKVMSSTPLDVILKQGYVCLLFKHLLQSYTITNPSTSFRACLQAICTYGPGNVYIYGLFGRNYYCSQKTVIDSERIAFPKIANQDKIKAWLEKYDQDKIDYFFEDTVAGKNIKKYVSPFSLFEKNHNFEKEKLALQELVRLNVLKEIE